MIEEDFQLECIDKNTGLLLSETIKDTPDFYDRKIIDRIKPHISVYLDNPHVRAFSIREKKKGETVGLILFNSHRILFLYLKPSITERKIPAFMLTGAAVSKMKEEGSKFIFSFFPRFRKILGGDDLSANPPLLSFFFLMEINLRLKTESMIFRTREGSGVPDSLSCYSFNNEIHIDPILQLSSENPDPFVQKLIPPSFGEQERRNFYKEMLFTSESGGRIEYSPDYSTVVYNESNRCIAYLLCNKDGWINGIRLAKKTVIPPADLLHCMLNRMAENLDFQRISEINFNCFEKDTPLIKWLKRDGFCEADEFPVWGWNEKML